MESGTGPSEFRRLIEEQGTVGELLRAADTEYRHALNEPRAFRELELRRQRRNAVRTAVGLFALAAAGIGGLRLQAPPGASAPSVLSELATAEPSAASVVASVPAVAPTAELAPPQPSAIVRPERRVLSRFVEPPVQRVDCSAVVGGNERVSDALRLHCYQELAQGSDVSSETALFELGRLNIARGDRPRALEFLTEHQRRFPGGALRGEVAELRISTLYELGRDHDALAESERALTTPWGRELAAKLHFLRGKIYEERLHDYGRAATEYVALISAATPAADDAEFRRARCFERLGREAEALAAYTRYLKRPRAAHREAAQARFDALSHRESASGLLFDDGKKN
jgi:tetratricopeptide (TPR) repeat protein